MKVHPRIHVVQKVETDFTAAYLAAVDQFEPCFGDELAVLSHFLSDARNDVQVISGALPPVGPMITHLKPAWEKVKKRTTEGERAHIVAGLLGSAAKYQIREERHGDRDKPGGLA